MKTLTLRILAASLSLAVHTATGGAPPGQPTPTYVHMCDVVMVENDPRYPYRVGYYIAGVYGEAEVVMRVGGRVWVRDWRPVIRTPRTTTVAPG